MGTINENSVAQGLGGYAVELDPGESVIVRLVGPRANNWQNGGFSWLVMPGAGGQISVEHSLRAAGDAWTEDARSPFRENYGDNEPGRIERIRFTAIAAAGAVDLLGPGEVSVALVE